MVNIKIALRIRNVFGKRSVLCSCQRAYIGSSNLDPRSLRLNFEIDLEVLDHGFAREIERRIETVMASATPVTLAGLRARPYVMRLIDRLIWLGSPYL